MPDQAQPIPPLLNAETSARRRTGPTLILVGFFAAMLIARVSENWQLPFMRCTFKAMSGVPCATCGSTRVFRALSRFEFAQAFWFNPLITTTALAFVAWFVFSLAAPETARRFYERFSNRPVLKLVILIGLLNWIYLILFLPR